MAARRGPSFKDILQLVPNFSGRDKEEANKFIKGCRLADELLEQNQKADFLKFIKVKLSGVALECINPTALASTAALTEFVEKNFGTRKLFFECYGDLSKLKQGKNEGVLTFFSRLKDLQREIEAAARRENKHNAAFEASLLADLLTAFKRGLRWEIKSQLTANNLEEARDEAVRIEREDGFDTDIDAISSYKSRRACCTICDSREHSTIDCNSLASLHKSRTDKCSYCHSPDHYLTNCMKFTVDTKEKESCSHCGSTEHQVNNCIKFAQRDKESVKKEKEPEVITINHISAPTCSVCSNKGHTASACNEFLSIMRNLINNSNNNNNDDCNNEFEINAINLASTITCGYCARKGHPASTCNNLLNAMRGFASKNNQTNNYSNKGNTNGNGYNNNNNYRGGNSNRGYNNNRNGYNNYNRNNNPGNNSQNEGNDERRCYNCNRFGHLARDCRMARRNQGNGQPRSSQGTGEQRYRGPNNNSYNGRDNGNANQN
ncbi:hypothetical protein TKK_0010029 [Trichogramma kaykai]